MANSYLSASQVANIVLAAARGGPFNTCEVAFVDRDFSHLDIHVRLSGLRDSKRLQSTHYPAAKAWDEEMHSDGSILDFILDGEEVLPASTELLRGLVLNQVSQFLFQRKAIMVAC